MAPETPAPRRLLRRMFYAAIDAADAARTVSRHLPEPPPGRTVVVGAGKAAAAMARAVEDNWRSDLRGLVVTPYGHAVATTHIEVVEAAHPVPDRAGREAARRILDLVSGLGSDELALCLISGGGSALLALPAEGVSLADKQAVNQALLRAGATIAEMNCVRKHLSAIKGGRLAAAAAPARLRALVISDVPGDDPSVIASGPTVADPTTFAEARAVLANYAIAPPAAVARRFEAAADETPKPGDARLANAEFRLVAAPQDALDAAAAEAYAAGFAPVVLGDSLEGEARDVGLVHAGIARQVVRHGQPAPAPCALLSGGETTVTLRGSGRGGRNAEFLLALVIALDGLDGVWALACDSDGIDGSGDNAGAIAAPDTLARARALGLDARARLADNDAYGFFAALGDLVVTGPTLTNVNDFRAILINSGR
ncbi:MAG: glycerate kinase [Alphaproteobacteria bacterium]